MTSAAIDSGALGGPSANGLERTAPQFTGAWLCAVGILALDACWPAAAPFGEASRFGLVLLVFLALAGVPAGGAARWGLGRGAPGRASAVLLGAALPPLALGLGLDLANGRVALGFGRADGAWTVLAGLSMLLVLTVAAALPHGGRARRAHGWAWFLLVPSSAALELALRWAPPGAAAASGDGLGLASPLVWCVRWMASGPAAAPLGGTGLALATCALVLTAATLGRPEPHRVDPPGTSSAGFVPWVALLGSLGLAFPASGAHGVAAGGSGAATQSAAEGRGFWGAVRCTGPIGEVRFDCGEDGDVWLRSALRRGEERVLELPFPVRSPLGASGLATVPAPVIDVFGASGDAASSAGAPGTVTWLGWIDEQPEARYGRMAPSLRTRPRPPAARAAARTSVADLAWLVAAFAVSRALGRRRLACAGWGLVAGLALATQASGRAPVAAPTTVLEVDLDAGAAVEVSGGEAELSLSAEGLARVLRIERHPGGGGLQLDLQASGGAVRGVLRAPGGSLWLLRDAPLPALEPASNGWEPLAPCWTRGADGRWRAHGAWGVGEALPAAVPEGVGTSPPGWLAAGLPPGRGVLVGRRAEVSGGGRWVRVVGFPVRGP